MKLKVLGSFILTTLLYALGQGQPVDSWHVLQSSNLEFDVAVPPGYLVYDDERWKQVNISGGADGAFFDSSFRKTDDGDEWIEALKKRRAERGEHSDSEINGAKVHTYRLKGDKAFQFSIFVATRKGYYTISITSSSSENPVLKAILGSIRLNGQRLLDGEKNEPPKPTITVKVDSLKSAEIVRTALRRKQTEKIDIVLGPVKMDEMPPGDRGKFFSRRLIVLQRPFAAFTDEARGANFSGQVKLRVLFKGNGEIGRITVIKGQPFGLTGQAIKAASAIKFLPAEILGMPADSEATIEYSFTTY